MKKKRTNFITRFMQAAGKTEVPPPFFRWSCISLLGALLGDRVWYEKHAGKKLHPNLYVLLIGSSASGKGTAIDMATIDVAGGKPKPNVPELFMYRGKATGAHLSDLFAKAQAELEERGFEDEAPNVYLICPEMSNSIGDGPQANDFVKRFTEFFTGGNYLYQEGTRTHGALSYQAPTINCLFGSTEDWLYESVSKAALRSGFLGRCCAVKADYDPRVRIARPLYPPNQQELMDWLIRRARRIVKLKGQFQMTQQAVELHDSWYENRPFPDDAAVQPSWKRADDLFYKFAMIVSVAKGRKSLIITSADAADAIEMTEECQRDVSEIIHGSHRGVEIEALDTVALYIRKHHLISHSDLLKKCSHRGIPAGGPKGVNTQLSALVQRGEIKEVRLKNRVRARAWLWTEDKIRMGGEEDETDESASEYVDTDKREEL